MRAVRGVCAARLLFCKCGGHVTPAHGRCRCSCLQCALGDAFRCGGCPYRGLPAFEMGKPIQLPQDFLAVDI